MLRLPSLAPIKVQNSIGHQEPPHYLLRVGSIVSSMKEMYISIFHSFQCHVLLFKLNILGISFYNYFFFCVFLLYYNIYSTENHVTRLGLKQCIFLNTLASIFHWGISKNDISILTTSGMLISSYKYSTVLQCNHFLNLKQNKE